MISLEAAIGWIVSALLGGAGLVGLLMLKPRHDIEKRIQREDEDRIRLNKVDKLDEDAERKKKEQRIK